MKPAPPSSDVSWPFARLTFDVAVRSDEGCVRTNNEDTPLAASLTAFETPGLPQREPPLLLAVCDGMGGAAAGEIASREAAAVILRELACNPIDGPASAQAVVAAAIRAASHHVFELAARTPEAHGMGTTATVCVVTDGEAVLGQVGDSRAYLLREGRLSQLTRDQTLRQLMIEKGQLDPAAARDFFGGHIILQAVGTASEVDVDVKRVALAIDDAILVCSDGLVDALDDVVIEATLAGAESSEAACAELIARARDAGATDNVTCVVARYTGNQGLLPAAATVSESSSDCEETPATRRSAPPSKDASAPQKRGWQSWLRWQKR